MSIRRWLTHPESVGFLRRPLQQGPVNRPPGYVTPPLLGCLHTDNTSYLYWAIVCIEHTFFLCPFRIFGIGLSMWSEIATDSFLYCN